MAGFLAKPPRSPPTGLPMLPRGKIDAALAKIPDIKQLFGITIS